MTTTTSTSPRSSSSGGLAFRSAIVGGAVVRCSTGTDGDFHRTAVPLSELDARRRGLVDLPWTMLDQRHGTEVRRVNAPGAHDGAVGDIAVTAVAGAVLGCWVADCAPVVLVGHGDEIAAVHAGWRGLAAGVLDVAAGAMAEPIDTVVLGPVIGPCCYEFGRDDLALVAGGLGTDAAMLASTTSWRTLALDVPAAIAGWAERLGAAFVRLGGCTGCTHPGFSHRVRRDPERQVVAVWREAVT